MRVSLERLPAASARLFAQINQGVAIRKRISRTRGSPLLQSLARTVEIPRSVPELTTERLLVMSFVKGDQITRLENRTKNLSARCGTYVATLSICCACHLRICLPITCPAGPCSAVDHHVLASKHLSAHTLIKHLSMTSIQQSCHLRSIKVRGITTVQEEECSKEAYHGQGISNVWRHDARHRPLPGAA